MAQKLKSPRIAEHYRAIKSGAYGQARFETAGTATSTSGEYFGRIFAEGAATVNYTSVDFDGNTIGTFTGVVIPAGSWIDGVFTDITVTASNIVCNYASIDE